MNADDEVIGFAKFTQDVEGVVHVNIKVSGLSAGKHGVHIHERASCGDTPATASASAVIFGGAGVHYSPSDGNHDNHRGDLPNLIVNDGLQGRLNTTTQRVTLSDGLTTVFDEESGKVGSAIVIHAREDRFGLYPTTNGDSGPRIACGVIVRK